MKEQKGFTLVELLGVITLLALVGLISVPIISNVVNNSRLKAFKQTLNGIIDSARIHNAESNYSLFDNGEIDLTDGTIQFENLKEIEAGKIYYDGKEYYLEDVKNDRFCAVGVLGKYNIYEGECGSDTILESNFDNY